MDIIEIEHQRRRHKISVGRLCAAAGVDDGNYNRLRKGEQVARADTLARLAAGLSAARKGEKVTKVQTVFRFVLGLLAYHRDIDIARVLAHNPQLKATSDPRWMEISYLRAIAIYTLHTVLGISNADVARAAGVTEAAVTINVQKIEGKRDDPALDRMFDMLEMAVAG